MDDHAPMTLKPEDLYHSAVIVDDVHATIERLAATTGMRFAPVMDTPFPVRIDGETRTLDMTLTYSVDAPHFEVVRAMPGTPWTTLPGRPLHHIGFWVDDLEAASRELEAGGAALEVCGSGEAIGPSVFAYHVGPDGLRIEIVDRATEPGFRAWLAAADRPGAQEPLGRNTTLIAPG